MYFHFVAFEPRMPLWHILHTKGWSPRLHCSQPALNTQHTLLQKHKISTTTSLVFCVPFILPAKADCPT